MSSRSVGVVTRSARREQQVNIVSQIPSEHEQDQDDDDVVESSASAFDRAKRHKPRGSRRGVLQFYVMSAAGGTTIISENGTHHKSDQANVELNDLMKCNKAVTSVEEPKFNCPICLCPFTEEMTTKCGHIFCKSCITDAITRQAKCPTCRKEVTVNDLIRVFLPTSG